MQDNFLSKQLSLIKQIKNGDACWEDLNQFRVENGKDRVNTDTLRKGAYLLSEYLDEDFSGGSCSTDEETSAYETIEIDREGNLSSKKSLILTDEDLKDPKALIAKHGFDPSKFELVSARNSIWDGDKDPAKKRYSSRIVVRPIEREEITFADIDKYFANKTDFPRLARWNSYYYDKAKEVLEIDLADLHHGLRSLQMETGKDFDLDVAHKYFKECFADIFERVRNKQFRKVMVCTLGDIIHFDNDRNCTTSGTFQDAGHNLYEVFAKTADLLIETLWNLYSECKCPVEYVYCCGNHDRNTGYFLAHTLKNYFRSNPDFIFDIDPNPIKAKKIGCTLLGLCHGDMPQKRLADSLIFNYRKEYGETKFATLHCGHLHEENVCVQNGVFIKRIPKMCESSPWEHRQGYEANKAVLCYVYNDDIGLRETWYTYI